MAETLVSSKKQGGLFGKEEKSLILDPLHSNNPVTVQILGVCSALAVTGSVSKSLVMAIALTLVTAFSNLVISLMRNTIPSSIRMIVQLIVVAALVQVVEIILGAFVYDLYVELSVFIGLIVTNCIVMGRLEAYAMANKPWQSFLDGIGNGLGYGGILVLMAVFRETLAKGTFMGWRVMPDAYVLNNLLVLPASSLFVIGIIIWIQRGADKALVDKS